jgi:hypothetical protein
LGKIASHAPTITRMPNMSPRVPASAADLYAITIQNRLDMVRATVLVVRGFYFFSTPSIRILTSFQFTMLQNPSMNLPRSFL